MGNTKRASMREGPLAALFRKTEESEEPPAGQAAQKEPPLPQPATEAAAAAPPPTHPRESGVPHPGLQASPPGTEEDVRVPTPRERLRQAFSSEIPENMMQRPGTVMDEYPREHGTAGPVGQPVIRVVGVGGGGVNAVNRMVEAEVEGIEFLAVNTDLQSLQQSTADI